MSTVDVVSRVFAIAGLVISLVSIFMSAWRRRE